MALTSRSPSRSTSARWLDSESSDLVRDFWQAAGGEEPFPRSLERSLAIALPVTVVKLSSLQLQSAERWLRSRGAALSFGEDGRSQAGTRYVHGCIVAKAGHGFLFLDGADSPDEMRFTIAHEIGHFMADHLLLRQRALALHGESIRPVLNGLRQPTVIERVSSALRGMSLYESANFLPRSESADGGMELWQVESRADRIGAALLAPPERVLSVAAAPTYAQRLDRAVEALVWTYGFPSKAATRYAQALLDENRMGISWSEGLRRPPGS